LSVFRVMYMYTGCGLSYHKRCAYKIPKNCTHKRHTQFYRPLSTVETAGSRTSSLALSSSPSSAQVCYGSLVVYSSPVGVRSIVINSVCLCVCLSVSISLEPAGPIGTEFFVQIPRGRGLVLLWRHCAMLCTSVLWMTARLAIMGCMVLRGWLKRLLAVSYVRDQSGV